MNFLNFFKTIAAIASIAATISCSPQQSTAEFCDSELQFASQQMELLLTDAYEANKIPRTLTAEGNMHWTRDDFDWTEGFFPGSCWYLYEFTKDKKWKDGAEDFQAQYKDHRTMPFYHDLGFVFNCSYGNGYRLTHDEAQKQVLLDAGNTLITRFSPEVGCIKSWDVDKGWQSKRGWQYPVIIDNMMNLEMLFELSNMTGDSKYKEVAISHANTTLKNHFREDYSCYHVIDYDSISGEVRNRHTAQGYAHESSWSRGQAWAIYGYTMCYRYTQDETYLSQAIKVADYIMNHAALPEDHIPYWDYDVPNKETAPRDASAAAITASAMLELSSYTPNGEKYLNEGVFILKNLASKNYRSELGNNSNFLLMHSVGSIPHNNEIDVPLNYADYYYIEGLMRLKAIVK